FYYSSTRPSVAQSGGEYQLTLVRYDRPVGTSAGMLSVVVDLEPDPSALAKMRDQILATTPKATFRQIPWSSGTVAAAAIGGDPVFGTPSLIGSNSTALAFALSTDQYLLLKETARDTASAPISIVYSLGYEAFRPEYEFSVQFNED